MRRAALAVVAITLASACRDERVLDERVVVPRSGQGIGMQTTRLSAGLPQLHTPIQNPFEDNVHAIKEGERLFQWFNCAGCHGAIGGGSMGPPLRDSEWIYGGAPVQIYRSILEGRPNGMPSFRGISEDTVWKLIAFVRTLGAESPELPGAVIGDAERSLRLPPDEAP